MKQEYILGLDASSSEIGISIFKKDTGELISLSHLTLESSTLLERGVEFKGRIEELVKNYNIIDACIEAPFVAMFGTGSSASTTAMLNQHNAMYQWICFSLGLKVTSYSPQEARKFALPGVKLRSKKLCGLTEKEQVFNIVCEKLGDSYFPKKTISRGKRKGELVFEDFCMDMSDAYIMGLAFLNKNKQ